MKPSSLAFYALLYLIVTICPAAALAQEYAMEQLEESPRHHEWVEVKNGDRTVHSFVAYPETSERAPVLIVIHENRGLTDWVRSFADQAAAAGYIAIAPDLLSEYNDDHPRTSSFRNSDAARSALYMLNPQQVTDDLAAVRNYAKNMAAANGNVAVAGFCWGGSQAFRFATDTEGLGAVMVFYGSPPDDPATLRHIQTPVYGFYGGEDERINATIEDTEQKMDVFNKIYEYEIYEGAGHAFMRRGDNPEGDPADRQARDRAWMRLREIMKELR